MGRGAYEALFTALAKYVPAPADVDTAMLARELQAMSRCQPDRCPWTPADTKRTGPAIATVSTWIEGAMPIVAAKTTPAHARALGVLRALLARRLMLVEETGAAKEPERKVVFAKTRDKLMAEMAAALHDDVSASHKVMLWGHNRHVNLSPTGAGHPSMGRRLADVDRDAVYAIGTFVGSGRALLLEDDEKAALDISERVVVDASRFSVDARLQEAAAGVPVAFFDLAGARTTLPATSPWRTRGASRLEGGQMDLALVDDYDGALWVSSVTAPELPGLSTAGRWLVRLHGVWSDHGFALSGLLALLTLGALYGVVALASRKKS
jgi:erythromycin esterase-like protein